MSVIDKFGFIIAGQLKQTDLPPKAIAATRQLAKRQLTWLRTQIVDGQYFDSLEPNMTQQVLKYLKKFVILT